MSQKREDVSTMRGRWQPQPTQECRPAFFHPTLSIRDPLDNLLISFTEGITGCTGTGTGVSFPEGRGVWGIYSTIDSAAAVEVEVEAVETAGPDCTGRLQGGLPEPGQRSRKGLCIRTIPACVKAIQGC